MENEAPWSADSVVLTVKADKRALRLRVLRRRRRAVLVRTRGMRAAVHGSRQAGLRAYSSPCTRRGTAFDPLLRRISTGSITARPNRSQNYICNTYNARSCRRSSPACPSGVLLFIQRIVVRRFSRSQRNQGGSIDRRSCFAYSCLDNKIRKGEPNVYEGRNVDDRCRSDS